MINIGLDTVTATANARWNAGNTISVNMAADQRIIYNSSATPLNGVIYYGNTIGNAFDVYSSSSKFFNRCNGTTCLEVGNNYFIGTATNASGNVTMRVTNGDAGATSRSVIEAFHGSGNYATLTAASNFSFLNSNSQVLVLGIGGVNKLQIDTSGNVAIGSTSATANLDVNGSVAYYPPIKSAATTFTISRQAYSIISGATAPAVYTLPAATTSAGRVLYFKQTTAFAVTSTTANVIPLSGGSAGFAILPGAAGKWCMLQSDGTNWNIMAAN